MIWAESSAARCHFGDAAGPSALYVGATAGSDGWVDETCSICGRTADPTEDGDPPLGWCADVVETRDGPHTRWVCAACTRKYVRAIEAKLEQQWW